MVKTWKGNLLSLKLHSFAKANNKYVEYSSSEFIQKIKIAADHVENYLDESVHGKGRVISQPKAEDLAADLRIEQWIREGGMDDQDINDFLPTYLENSMHMHHPQYIGHQVAVPHLASGIADFIHGAINNPMAIYEMGPSSSVIEQSIINWMLEKVGWFKGNHLTDFRDIEGNGGGIMTHGGSLANLTALLAARAHISPDSWDQGTDSDLVVIGSEVAHYSILRSISIMGLGKKALVAVETDKNEVLDVSKLRNVISECRNKGKRIMAIIANACATSTGLYDPIDEIGSLCNEENIWYHVDGAHGASALLHDKISHLMNGTKKANSLIWDTHKMLRTTTLSAAVLFRKSEEMNATFQQKGSYLFHEKEEPGFDLMPYTVECTKGPIATKLFWVLGAMGEKGLGDYVYGRYALTRDIYNLLNQEEDFYCPYVPEANIICFLYKGGQEGNEFQLALRNLIIKRGNFYITSTEVSRVRYLRLTVINPHTDLNHIRGLIEEIRTCAKLL